MKLTGTGEQTDRQTGKQDHVLSQADALTKNIIKHDLRLKCSAWKGLHYILGLKDYGSAKISVKIFFSPTKFCVQKNPGLGPQQFWEQKNDWSKKIWVYKILNLKTLWVHKHFGSKKILGQKFFWVKKNFASKKILDLKKFWSTKIWVKQMLCSKKF